MRWRGSGFAQRLRCAKRDQQAITLIEMMVVVALMALIAGISFPAVTSGLDTLRLRQAGEAVVGLVNSALDRAERRQQPIEIVIDRNVNAIAVIGAVSGIERIVEMPQGVRILAIAPPLPQGDLPVRSFLVVPSGAVPRISVLLTNARGALRSISIDPVTGVARMDQVAAP